MIGEPVYLNPNSSLAEALEKYLSPRVALETTTICLYLLHNYQSSVQASSCRCPLVSINLFLLMIEMQITLLVVWNDWGNPSI